MDTITTLEYQGNKVRVQSNPDGRHFFSATDLSEFLPVKNVSCVDPYNFAGYQLIDLMAISVEKEYPESSEILNFVSFVKRSGYSDATIERLHHACRIHDAWKTSKVMDLEKKQRPESVYLIGCKQNKAMKIGYSQCVEDRICSLQTSSPFQLTLLETVKGSKSLEKKLHTEFHHLRINREWFTWSDDIIEKFKMLQQVISDS